MKANRKTIYTSWVFSSQCLQTRLKGVVIENMEKSTMLKLFAYDNYMTRLETREAIEFYKAIKLRMDKMSKAASLKIGQKLKELNMVGMPKADDHGDDNRQRIDGDIEEIEVEAETNFQKVQEL